MTLGMLLCDKCGAYKTVLIRVCLLGEYPLTGQPTKVGARWCLDCVTYEDQALCSKP